ncbi:bone morphogenetic protein 10-like [Mizuhopecten yessoensis]|uniref:Protein DVR-1 n=1 Tax=Mizuhopecten yessoensis TaxID=6573 RepID=A0A210Q486_MIZYE|nr:bone morphogenetic protein 10-like [Mizuhopecten yessoensis]OWF43558.1 Protein DVR-1 [Mizuhopecten yessoensis]
MKEGCVNVKYRLFCYYSLFYITLLFVCFTRVRQDELLKSLYRNMRYTPEHKDFIPAITLRRFLQLTDTDNDPSYRRQAVYKLDSNTDNYEQVKIFYSKQVRGEQSFNVSRRIANISKIQRADIVIKDYDHSLKRVRVSFQTGPHTRRYHHWKIAKWSVEGHALNVTRHLRHHLRKGQSTIKIQVCVKNRENFLQCTGFGKFSIALVIQLNVNLNVWHEFSTPYMDVLDKLSEREKYQTRIKRSGNDEITETPIQDTQVPGESTVEIVESNICHVHPWSVAFADIGWYHVLAPLTVQANFCSGGCPSPLSSHPSLHFTFQSVIVDLYRTYYGHSSATGMPPEPCCTPTAMAPLSVYNTEDDGSHTLMRLEAVRVTSCGCR